MLKTTIKFPKELINLDRIQEAGEGIVSELTDICLKEAQRGCPVRSGHLKSTLRKAYEAVKGVITGQVYTDCDYAEYVEDGTSRQAPYPFMRPAAEKTEKIAANIAAKRIRGAL